jgi:hypothetical protein
VTVDSAESADEAPAFADAFDFAVTVVAVTSPPSSETVEISDEALEVAEVPGEANAPEVIDPTDTTEPSAGYAYEAPTPTASGGAETSAAEPLPCPGTAT